MGVNLGTAVGYLDLDTSKFKAGFSGARKELKGFTSDAQNFSSRTKMIGNAMSSVGSVMTKTVTPAIVGVGAVVTKTGATFESAMSQVAATMGKSKSEIKDLEKTAIEMGSKTSFSATQAAEGLNYLALAGYTSEQQIAALPKVLNLAAAGNMELADASDMLTDAMSSLGLASSDSKELMNNMNVMVDQMAKTASKSNTSVAQLGEGILTVGGTAKQLAGGTTELNTVLGLLADNGIKASEGGTHLRNILLAMQPTTDAAAAAFEKLGLKTYDTQGNLRPLEDIFYDLKTAMADMTEEEKQAIETAIFNKTDLSAVNALLSTSTERWEDLSGAIKDSSGAADEMSKTQLDNLKGDFTLLGSALEGLQIRFYNLANGSLRGIIQRVTEVIDKLNGLSDAQLDMIAKIALVVAAIGPALVIGGKIISTVGTIIGAITKIPMILSTISTAFSALTTLIVANPIGLAITAIIAVVALLAVAWKKDFGGIQEKTKEFIDFIKELPDKIKKHFDNSITKVKDFKDKFVNNAKEAGKKFVSNVDSFMSNLPYNLGVLLGKAIIKVLTFKEEFKEKAKESGVKFVESIFEGLKDLSVRIFQKLSDGIKKAQEFKEEFPEKAKEAGKRFVSSLKDKMSDIKNTTTKIKETAIDAIHDLPSKFRETAKNAMDSFKQGIKDKIESIKNTVSSFVSGITSGLSSVSSSKVTTVSGSHKAGLDYVPYDGYIARLHKGEAVLTEQENKYRNGKAEGNVFIFNGTPPLDEREAARQFRLSQQQLALKYT